MKDYTSCFIGIPLPDMFQEEFEKLLMDIKNVDFSIETTYSKTPHITLCYLDKQSQNNLASIMKIVKNNLSLVKEIEIKVGGLGYFRGDDPKVLFLQVSSPFVLEQFSKKISNELSEFSSTENNLPFHPHMTVGWLDTPSAKEVFIDKRQELDTLMNREWIFNLDEIVLYGVDSTMQPQFQKKLLSI